MILETAIVILTLMLLGFVFYFLMQKRLRQTKEAEFLALLSQYGEIETEDNLTLFLLNSNRYQIVFFYVPFQGELTINSKTMWETKVGNQTTLTNQTHLVNHPSQKIVIVYPSMQKIKRFINENELEFIKYDELVNNMYIVLGKDLKSFLEAISNDL